MIYDNDYLRLSSNRSITIDSYAITTQNGGYYYCTSPITVTTTTSVTFNVNVPSGYYLASVTTPSYSGSSRASTTTFAPICDSTVVGNSGTGSVSVTISKYDLNYFLYLSTKYGSDTYNSWHYGIRFNFDPIPNVTVTFNPGEGGSVSPTTKTVTYGQQYGSLPTPTKSGYTFDGWFNSDTGGSQVTSSTIVSVISNHTLYARYSIAPVTITFNPIGGSVSPTTKTVTYGQQYGTLPTPTKTNERFAGWFTAQSGGSEITSTSIVSVIGSQTLYAHWLDPAYVVFDPNGGDTLSGATYKIIYEGDAFGTLPTTTRTSVGGVVYTFAGWFTAESGGVAIDSTTVYLSSMGNRMYAHWNENTVTITFDADGGVVSPSSAKYVPGSQYGTLPMPLKSGYTFQNWKLGEQIVTTESIVPSIDSTLDATYSEDQKSYTVRYADPDSGDYEDVEYIRDEEYEFPSVTSIFPGYTPPTGTQVVSDSCWVNKKSGDVYGESQTFTNLGSVNEIVIVNINFVSRTLVIRFNANGGSVSQESKTVMYGQPIGALPIPTKTGKFFNGWFTDLSGGDLVLAETIMTSAGYLYASWRDTNEIHWMYGKVVA